MDIDAIWAALKLKRLPENTSLFAYDGADRYLLKMWHELGGAGNILLLNDYFGALATAILKHRPAAKIISSSDSVISQICSEANLGANHCPANLNFIKSTELGAFCKSAKVDIVLGKIPKQLAFFGQQLCELRQAVEPTTPVLLAAMQKHLPKQAHRYINKFLGSSGYYPSYKKARLFCAYKENRNILDVANVAYQVGDAGLQFTAQSNVFSRDKLDMGSRLMLENYEKLPAAQRILDLACGNGVLGIMAKNHMPNAQLYFADESFMAMASCKQNYQQASAQFGGNWQHAEYYCANGLTGIELADIDLILLNPPFHQQHSIGDFVAKKLIEDSQRVLSQGGHLWLVGNRHLAYRQLLARYFKNLQLIASNNQFVVWQAQNKRVLF